MMKTSLRGASLFLLLSGFLCVGLLSSAAAEPDGSLREADRHFQRGVALYIEADYRGALVEFSRAYTLAPNGIVLFNVGETQYQLRDYAAALATFQQYLIEAPQADAHRSLAEANIKELRTRVGRLRIVTVPPGAEVSIDDRVIGQTPFDKPVVVGIGQLTVRVTMPGRPPVVRSVDVAAEDDVPLTIELPAEPSLRAENSSSSSPTTLIDQSHKPAKDMAGWRVAGWVTTGLLAGGAVAFGLLARNESKDLAQARQKDYPAIADNLNHLAKRTTTFSIVADSLTAAAVVVGGVTLYSTISARSERASQVSVGLGSLRFDMRF